MGAHWLGTAPQPRLYSIDLCDTVGVAGSDDGVCAARADPVSPLLL